MTDEVAARERGRRAEMFTLWLSVVLDAVENPSSAPNR